jgi:CheY-like chemotaxis protein
VLLALRAAAVLVIATGVNDVIAGAVPSYQPLYVYLGAVALVVSLDGVAIGLIAALAATATYALLFMPRAAAMSTRILAPLSAMVGTALVIGVLRALVRARRREPAQYVPVVATPLLAAPPPPAPDMTEVLDAIEDLRAEMRSAVTRDEADELERVRARERTLARDHADAEARAMRAAREVETLHAEVLDRTARVRELETTLESERGGARGMAARVGELQSERQEMRRALETARTNAGSQTARADRLERELAAARAEVADRDAHWNSASVEATVRAAALEAERTELRRELETARANVAAQVARIAELDAASANAATRIAELKESAETESATLRRELDAARAEATAQAARITDLEMRADAESANLRRELDAARTDATAQVAHIAELEQSAALADAERASSRRELDTARTEAAAQATRITELKQIAETADAENVNLRRELEQAREESNDLRHELDLARLEAAAQAVRITQAETRAAEEQASASSHAARIAELDADLLAQTERLAELERDFDERLQTIVNHLAADHEADLGKAVEEREAARAEVRSLTTRATSMQRMIEDMRGAAQKEIDHLRRRIDDLERGAAPRAERRPRVLVAYPDPDMRAAARASLERAGYEIFSAADGLEALRTAMASQPDVVIADAAMPKMDGRELCQMLKSQEKTAAIRVVLLARAGETVPRGEHPADEILHKPVPLEALKTTLAQLVPGTRP